MDPSCSRETKQCCCGPYPAIDFSDFFASATCDGLKEDISAACEKFGCFHVSIAESSLNEHFAHFKMLSDEDTVKKSVEGIFHPDFISSHVSNNTSTVSFPYNDDTILTAKYRGRDAESGSTSGLEPKQSWEYFRCHNMLERSTSDAYKEGAETLLILKDYSRILHRMSQCLFSILNMPNGKFLEQGECKCSIKGNRECDEGDGCTMDLLRVFLYDALQNVQEVNTNLGSSPHTDWGSLTVVWQDSKGGLQIYCHQHECWNDVHPPTDNVGKFIRFFIHIGDFTSLAMSGSSVVPTKKIVWPSPLHRVLCPLRESRKEHMDNERRSSDTRCSLVYFAYPPCGVSLQDAQISLCSKRTYPTTISGDVMSPLLDSFPFDRYMVLKDQSQGSEEPRLHGEKITPETEMYEQMLNEPFDAVIRQKWEQVQR